MPGQNIRIKNIATCQYCKEDDDIQHLFLFCSKTHNFWELVEKHH